MIRLIGSVNMYFLYLLIFIALSACTTDTDEVRFDPAVDDPSKEWCYLAESAVVIGIPFMRAPVQVTYDGAVYTGNAELGFFYGEQNKPLLARQKTFLDGWIPIVQYDWQDEGILYKIELFSTNVGDIDSSNVIQFVRLEMENKSGIEQKGFFGSFIRGSAGMRYYRMLKPKWKIKIDSKLEFSDDIFFRDGKAVYFFKKGGRQYSIPEEPYTGPFLAGQYDLSDSTATGMVRYERLLQPDEKFSVVFKMPQEFLTDSAEINTVRNADFDTYRDKTIHFWKNLIEGRQKFVIPEKRVNDSYKASLVHMILATRTKQDGKKTQGSGLPYDSLFLNDYMDMVQIYELGGLPDFVLPNVEWLLKKQYKTGMFIDVHNRGNDDIVTSHGQALFSLAFHYVMTRDAKYAEQVYPAVRKGVGLIIHDHQTDKYGLMRPSIPYDAPMVTGHFMCHNLFSFVAMEESIRMAHLMGETEDAANWTEALKSYKGSIQKAVENSIEKEGYIRSGLYDWNAGWVQGKKGQVNLHPNQDWENNLLVWPTEFLSADDPRVMQTLSEIRRRHYREGVMTYRNNMHIHQYVTLNQTQQYLALSEQEKALSDLYHVLLHNGSTHEGFENMVIPWTRIVASFCPPPHAWAAAKTALFIRNMMVREYGGQRGLMPDERDLYLFSLISPSWVKPGNKLEIDNAVTEMGHVSSTMTFTTDGAEIKINPDFFESPAHLVLTVPYFVDLISVEADTGEPERRKNWIFLSPNTTQVNLHWRIKEGIFTNTYQNLLTMYRSEYGYMGEGEKADLRYRTENPPKPFLTGEERAYPAVPLSFGLVRKAYEHEYERRFKKFEAKGGTVDRCLLFPVR